MKPAKCCGLCHKGEFLKLMTILVVIIDIFQVGILSYFAILFFTGTKSTHFQPSYAEGKTIQ